MNSSTQIIGIKSLFGALATALFLTIMLGSMVWSRVSLLQDGKQIVLKTRPVDPRDFLRGYYVHLNYDISRISLDELAQPDELEKKRPAFKRHSLIFVKLQRGDDGFWSPISLHRTKPTRESGNDHQPDDILIRGRVLYGTCPGRANALTTCKVSIRYGIEKFFAQKKRARKLENFSRQTSPEMDELDRRLKAAQKEYNQKLRLSRDQNRELGKRKAIRTLSKSPEIVKIRKRLRKLRKQHRILREQNNKAMAKRFAVIVRVDKKTGEAAISGLQLDGRQIYEEPLF
ncbi:MAG: GDYXXLXY domain-containing protein [Hyphomicrobiaceae bacterium]|nr:GDYXXLXY domain-containing protein [Hyphomicrobiaceae bacterium]